MANQPHNPQQPNQQQQNQPAKNDGGRVKDARGQQAKPGLRPQDPADLGHDPKPADVQAAGRLGQSSEKSRH